jgi:hypothetical protein
LARRHGVSAFMPPVTPVTASQALTDTFHARIEARPGSLAVNPAAYSRAATVSASAVTG